MAAHSTVWSFGVVVSAPLLDLDLGFAQAAKDLAVEQFVALPHVEAFAIPALPCTARQGITWRYPERGDFGSM